ncbi:MAG: nitrogenase component 1 [Lachnospiraceae bacterium]|nr:nitrogenase component 1 [Lachnospiraceae bacterium]
MNIETNDSAGRTEEVFEEMIPGMETPLGKILARNNLALVVTGSAACVRGIYSKVRNMGKLDQLFLCPVDKEVYAAGKQSDPIRHCLEEAVHTEGIEGVVIYASCLDVLTQTDFDGIIQKVENPMQIPIETLLRGPLVKRYQRPAAVIDRILERMPENRESFLPHHRSALPPLYPDFNNIAAAFRSWDRFLYLVSTGGCGSACCDTEESGADTRFRKTRLDDLQVTLGCEEVLELSIGSDCVSEGGSSAFLIGTMLTSVVGTDEEQLCESLRERGISADFLFADGFRTGPEGPAQDILQMSRMLLQPVNTDENRINILGHNPMAIGRREKIAHGIEHMEWRDFTGYFFGDGTQEEVSRASSAKLNWVVSTEGLPLARYMEEQFGIPYLAGIPIGKQAMIRWRKDVNVYMDRDDEELPERNPAAPSEEQIPILILGEPLLGISLEKAFQEEFGQFRIQRAVYAPAVSLQRFYRENLGEDTPIFFRDESDLRKLLKKQSLVVADPLYKNFIEEYAPDSRLLEIPDPGVSGMEFVDMEYQIFGKKGAAYMGKAFE